MAESYWTLCRGDVQYVRGQRCSASQALSGAQGDSVALRLYPERINIGNTISSPRGINTAVLFAVTLETGALTIFCYLPGTEITPFIMAS